MLERLFGIYSIQERVEIDHWARGKLFEAEAKT